MGLEIEHNGKKFRLNFKRVKAKERTLPDTLVMLETWHEHLAAGRVLIAGWEPVLGAKVGCFPTDAYSKEAGRVAALRKLAGRLEERDLAAKLMQAYFNRPRPKDPKALRLKIEQLTEELKQAVTARTLGA